MPGLPFLSYFLESLKYISKFYIPYAIGYTVLAYFSYVGIVMLLFYIFYRLGYIFNFYLLCTVGFIVTFFTKYKVLHFEQWLLIFAFIWFSQIVIWSPLDRIIKNIGTGVVILITSLILKSFSIDRDNLIERMRNYLTMEFGMESTMLPGLILFISLIILYVIFRVLTEAPKRSANDKKLYEERKTDRNMILNFLGVDKDGVIQKIREKEVSVLGLEDDFGEGKTFLIKKVIEKLPKEKFETININCLLLDAEDVYPYIVKQLNKVLIKNNIYSGHFERVMNSIVKSIDSKYLGGLSNMFSRYSNIDDIQNFKKAISTLNKDIVLIFDDFDRATSSEKIEKLFSFIDDFSGKNVKSLVLYNSINLNQIESRFDRNYIEKYIPITISLTNLSFEKLLAEKIKEYENNNFQKQDFDFLNSILTNEISTFPRRINYENKKVLFHIKNSISNLPLNIGLLKITARKVEYFINELFNFEASNCNNIRIEKRLLIAFFFLKTFMYEEFYKKIPSTNYNFSLEELFPIKFEILSKNVILDLRDLSILKTLIFNTNRILRGNQIIEEIKIGKNRVFFMKKTKFNIFEGEDFNFYLNKLKIEEINEFTFENVKNKLREIKKILTNDNVKLVKESENNLFIHLLFDYFFILVDENKHKIYENNEKIIRAIKKMKYNGTNKYLSSYRYYYEDIKKVFNSSTIQEQYENYIKWMDENYKQKGKDIICSEDYKNKKTMIVFDVFDDQKLKINLLKLLENRNDLRRLEEYLVLFLIGNIKDIKRADFIISLFLKRYRYFLKNIYSNKNILNLIRRKITLILPRRRLPVRNNQDLLSNIDFYKKYLNYNAEGVRQLKEDSKIINNDIKKQIQFINILVELENDTIDLSSTKNSYTSFEKFLKEEENIIQNMWNDDTEIKELEELYLEGKPLEDIGEQYSKLLIKRKSKA